MKNMQISKESSKTISPAADCFLLLLSGALHEAASAAPAALPEVPDEAVISQVILLSHMHNVPLVCERLYRMGLGGKLRETMRRDLVQVAAYEAGATQLLLLLLDALRKEGVCARLVKGAVCRSLYPNPGLRPSSDEDIYVEDAQTAAAEAVLLRLGYSRLDEAPADEKAVHTWSKGALRIELHSSLFDDLAIPAGADAAVLKNCFHTKSWAAVEGKQVMTLHPQEHFIYLVLHYYKHFLAGGVGIRQICDICLFSEKYGGEICWNEVWDVLRRLKLHILLWNIRDIGIQYLGMGNEIMPGANGFPPADSRELLCDTLNAGIFGASTLERKHSSIITIRAAQEGAEEKGNIRAALFPAAKGLHGRYPYLRRYPWLLPVAWCSRWIKYLKEGKNPGGRAAQASRIGKQRLKLLEQYGIVERGRTERS